VRLACAQDVQHAFHAGGTGCVSEAPLPDDNALSKESDMSSIRTSLNAALVALAISPALANAGSLWHDVGGEPGAMLFPGHGASRPAAEARAELEAARADGSLALYQRGFPVAPKGYTPTPRTRDEVKREIRGGTAGDRATPRDIYVGG
jgi:hypothetical protein